MTVSAPQDILVVHQLEPEFEQLAAPRLPAGVRLIGLPPEHPWDIPDEARVLVAGPRRRTGTASPPSPVPGWPRGLAWIQTLSTGVDAYPRWIFEGPVITCGRGLHAIPIAEFVLASMLAVEKRFPAVWVRDAASWHRHKLGSLHGKTLGLIGFGAIGTAIAERAIPFGMRVLAHRRSGEAPGVSGVALADFKTAVSEADHLILAVPLTPATRHILGAGALALVKHGVHIVNIARGGVLDQDALQAALDDGRVGFASLDVTDPEPLPAGHRLYGNPNVNISPHLSAGGSADTQGFVNLFLDNLNRFLAGADLLGRVLPDRGY
jgi:phosphoglycerate dehydrogenase-like enzyme